MVACNGNDQYQVCVDGSRHITKRYRKFLRPFYPVTPLGHTLVPGVEAMETVELDGPSTQGGVS